MFDRRRIVTFSIASFAVILALAMSPNRVFR